MRPLDNLETGKAFGSPALDMALTSQEFSDRILGLSKIGTAQMNAVYLLTGNNVGVRGDLARRLIPIFQDPRTERPEQRTGFRHPDLLDWVLEHRAEILSATYTILVAHAQAGRPGHSAAPLGGFEKWDQWIRSAVRWLGCADPCQGMEQIHEEGDEETENRRELLEAIHECMGEREFSAAELTAAALSAQHDEPLPDGQDAYRFSAEARLYQVLRPENGWKLATRHTGYLLKAAKNAPTGNLALRNRLDRDKKAMWRVERRP